MKVKMKIFVTIFFCRLWHTFPRDLENFQGWQYGAEAPKVQEINEFKSPYIMY